MAIATGQFTIIDYNDALTLTGFIGSNHPKTQIFNPDNGGYTPNWSATNLVLTPSLYKLGTTTDIITTAQVQLVEWFEVANGKETKIVANTTYSFSGAKSHILTVKSNVLSSVSAKDYNVIVTYRDETTNLDLQYKTGITFSKVTNGGGIVDAIAWAPDGNVFKNGTVESLIAECDLWRGSVVDTTLVTYQWYKQDASVTSDQGGGVGWRKLDSTTNYGVTGYTTRKITVPSGAVASFAVFKCIIKDTDSSSNSHNQAFSDSVSFIDNSDPYQVTITSSGGDIFKNGVGSTVLTAKVFQAGTEIDSNGTKFAYKWYKYDKNGALDVAFGGPGVNFKSGKTLAVGDSDVDVKGTFQVELN